MPEPLIYSPGPSHAAPSPSTCPSRPRACSLHLGRGGGGERHTRIRLWKTFWASSDFSMSFSQFLNDPANDSQNSQSHQP